MSWDCDEKAVDYTYHCTTCFGLGMDQVRCIVIAYTAEVGHCDTCEGTGRTPIPWAELFPTRRPV